MSIITKDIPNYLQVEIEKYFDKLWPICRSITGNGLRHSFEILSEIVPLKLNEVPTGTKVLDWEIPKEWNISEAYIELENGVKILDFKDNNLHVVNYSAPIEELLSFEELEKHLYFKKDLPDAIPYITSYYKEKWGFCLSYNQFLSLDKALKYKVVIKSSLSKGSLTYGDIVLKGKSNKEVFFTSYLCHPSMANNELSGPLTLAFLYKEIVKLPNRKFTYRFALCPETIGAIAYLEKNGNLLKENVIAAYGFTCCGDEAGLSYKETRDSNTMADIWLKRTAKRLHLSFKIHSFDPVGSDERQYCSPGYNLPYGSIMRTKYHDFKEYHTSLDNKEFINFNSLAENVSFCLELVKTIESSKIFTRTNPFGEPNLGKRNLYEDLANKQNMPNALKLRMRLLNFCDGRYDVDEFIKKYNFSVSEVNTELDCLASSNLIKPI
ncbi:MAG: DUF4910 domain-containing protein [Luteibaculaceae bacterium]